MALFLIPIVILLALKYDKRHFKYILIFTFLTFILTDFIHYYGFKEFFQRLRPCWDVEVSNLCRILVPCGGEYGFVSGHAANMVGVITMIFLSIPNLTLWIKDCLVIWVVLICYSRIYVGKHYPLDVLFGVLFGCLTAITIFRIYQYIVKKIII